MRIRKNRKILAEDGCSSTPISFTVCQLNRAPWDDDSCFSQFLQEQWDDCLPVNGSFVDYIHASDSRDLRELSLEFIEKTGFTTKLVDDQVEPKTTSFCKKRRSTVAEPKKLTPPAPLPPSIPAEPRKRGRPKKPKPTLPAPATGSEANNDNNNTNPYSYYYYSGFGPSWGKRRGGNTKHCKNENSYMNKNGGNCNWGMDNCVSNTSPGSDSSMSQTEDDDNGGQDEDEKKYAKKSCDIVIVDEVLDYIDDDFDDDDEDEDGFGQKRPRKPIKARSLKSLM